MRMWIGVKPSWLCRQHLLGEHYEIHKALGNLKNNGKWTKNLTKHGYLDPQQFKMRHDILAKEIQRRGYHHNSPLDTQNIDLPRGHVNPNLSIIELFLRCNNCGVEK